jgi:hypothetical protein
LHLYQTAVTQQPLLLLVLRACLCLLLRLWLRLLLRLLQRVLLHLLLRLLLCLLLRLLLRLLLCLLLLTVHVSQHAVAWGLALFRQCAGCSPCGDNSSSTNDKTRVY